MSISREVFAPGGLINRRQEADSLTKRDRDVRRATSYTWHMVTLPRGMRSGIN